MGADNCEGLQKVIMMKCIQLDTRKPEMSRIYLVFASMLKILDGTIEVFTLGYVRSTFHLEFMRRRLKYLLRK